MKWKDVLIGAFASLMVTVIGGIAVYYFTKEPTQKTEKIVYSVQQSASFEGGNQRVSFTTVRVRNDGGNGAKKIAVSVSFASAVIKDFALGTDAGVKAIDKEVKGKSLKFVFETLLPGETITLNLLLSASEKPDVSVRSETSLGLEQTFDIRVANGGAKIGDFLERAVPLTGLLLALLVALLYVLIRRAGSLGFISSDKNNAGFMMLHHGFIDDAAAILNDAVHSGRYDAFTLSNLAVCKALKGEYEQATQLLKAANFHESNGHTKAVILFNEALVDLVSGNKDNGVAKLKQAIEKSSNSIRRYCRSSVHLNSFRNDPAIFDLIK